MGHPWSRVQRFRALWPSKGCMWGSWYHWWFKTPIQGHNDLYQPQATGCTAVEIAFHPLTVPLVWHAQSADTEQKDLLHKSWLHQIVPFQPFPKPALRRARTATKTIHVAFGGRAKIISMPRRWAFISGSLLREYGGPRSQAVSATLREFGTLRPQIQSI